MLEKMGFIVFSPGIFIGLPILDAFCAIFPTVNFCLRTDSGTSTAEGYTVLMTTVLFYFGLIFLIKNRRRLIKTFTPSKPE